MTNISALQRLLRPTTIAVVGGKEAAEVIRQCDRIGYEGQIWPVNPKRETMVGHTCYPHVLALPHSPDATFIAVPRTKTIEVVGDLAQQGAGGAVCYASGFAEVGDDGVVLQQQLVETMADMAIVGPNCYGVLNYLDGAALWPDQHGGRRVERGVAIIAQSGNIGVNLTMQRRSLALGYLISVGNQAGVAIHEYIEALIADERVTAIGLLVEGLTDIAAFSRAALQALTQGIPLVILKTGQSEMARQIALSHTSSMTGADTLYDALFNRCGIMRVNTLPQFVEALKLLSTFGPLPSRKIASISCSGGEAGLVADMAESLGLVMPPLLERQHQALHAVLGDEVALGNPLDYHTYIWDNEPAQYRCFAAMLGGTQDITLKILDFPRPDVCDDTTWLKTARAFSRAITEQGKRGVVVATLPESLSPEVRRMLVAQGVVPMQGLTECLRAIKGAAEIFQTQQLQPQIQPLLDLPSDPTDLVTLGEAQSKRLMQQYDIPVPQSVVCPASEAADVATRLGFPVVVKLVSDRIFHKTEVGGVHLNLQNSAAVKQAVLTMRPLGDRFLIEAMAPAPLVEVILGVTRDPQFGLALVVGAGGILAELLDDYATFLFPVQRYQVETALDMLKIAPLFKGYRGQPSADKAALVDAVMNLARFTEDHAAHIAEIDLNPIFVLPQGQGVLAVDAVVRMSGYSSQ